MFHNTRRYTPPPAGWETGGTPLLRCNRPRPCRLGNRRYAPPPLQSASPLPVEKPAVRPSPAAIGPAPCRLGNRRYAPPRLAWRLCEALLECLHPADTRV